MAAWKKRLAAIRANPRDVRIDDLVRVLERLGFEEVRRQGSHRIFRKPGVAHLVNALAAAEGVSLNQLMVAILAEGVGKRGERYRIPSRGDAAFVAEGSGASSEPAKRSRRPRRSGAD